MAGVGLGEVDELQRAGRHRAHAGLEAHARPLLDVVAAAGEVDARDLADAPLRIGEAARVAVHDRVVGNARAERVVLGAVGVVRAPAPAPPRRRGGPPRRAQARVAAALTLTALRDTRPPREPSARFSSWSAASLMALRWRSCSICLPGGARSGCQTLACLRRASWTSRFSNGGSSSSRRSACSMSRTCGTTFEGIGPTHRLLGVLLSDYTTLAPGRARRALRRGDAPTRSCSTRVTGAERPVLLPRRRVEPRRRRRGLPGHGRPRRHARRSSATATTLHVAAGEPWDALVAHTVGEGLAGIEALVRASRARSAPRRSRTSAPTARRSSETIMSVRAFDRTTGETVDLAPERLRLRLPLQRVQARPGPLRRSCASSFALRRRRGSRRRSATPSWRARSASRSATRAPLRRRPRRVLAAAPRQGHGPGPRRPRHASAPARSSPTRSSTPPRSTALSASRAGDAAAGFPEPDGRVKTVAAWLIDHAGFTKGYGNPRPASRSPPSTCSR